MARFIAAATAEPDAMRDAKTGAAAWVACEVVAARHRKSTSDLVSCPEIRKWADQGIRSGMKLNRDLVIDARVAQERLESEGSGFARLWRKVDDQRFQWAMNSLRRRLAPKSKPKGKAREAPQLKPLINPWKEFDDVQDWVGDLVETEDLSLLEQLLAAASSDKASYLDVKDGAGAWVACELVAALYQNSTTDLASCPDIQEWAEARMKAGLKLNRSLRGNAMTALETVLGKNSEMAELWKESDPQGFEMAVKGLRKRLEPKAKGKK